MERYIKKVSVIGIMLLLIPSMHGIDTESDYQSLFLNNKTKHDIVVHFCNEDYQEQQQYPMKSKEHRAVRIKMGVMKKLYVVQVTMKDPKTGKKIAKDIDYEKDAKIVGLEIAMKPDLDLLWRHEEEYIVAPVVE